MGFWYKLESEWQVVGVGAGGSRDPTGKWELRGEGGEDTDSRTPTPTCKGEEGWEKKPEYGPIPTPASNNGEVLDVGEDGDETEANSGTLWVCCNEAGTFDRPRPPTPPPPPPPTLPSAEKSDKGAALANLALYPASLESWNVW